MELGSNGGWGGFVAVIETPHSDPLLTGFEGLQRAEARQIKNLKYKSATTERGNEKHSIITTTDVQENKRYVHINYDSYFLIN